MKDKTSEKEVDDAMKGMSNSLRAEMGGQGPNFWKEIYDGGGAYGLTIRGSITEIWKALNSKLENKGVVVEKLSVVKCIREYFFAQMQSSGIRDTDIDDFLKKPEELPLPLNGDDFIYHDATFESLEESVYRNQDVWRITNRLK